MPKHAGFAAQGHQHGRESTRCRHKTCQSGANTVGVGTPSVDCQLPLIARQTDIWVIARDSLQIKALPAGADEMRLAVALFRQQIEAEDKAVVVTAKNLYAILIAPLTLAPRQDIICVPYKSLHLLPFQALHDGSQWLVHIHAISTVLYASLLIPGAAQGAEKSLAALGNPDLGRAEWSLSGAEREVKEIQAFNPKSNIYLNKEASKAQLTEVAPRANCVHVTTHGTVDEIDPIFLF